MTEKERQIAEFKEQLELAQDLMINSLQRVAESGELFQHAAKCYWELYVSLKEQGFTEDQAMSIVQRYNPLAK